MNQNDLNQDDLNQGRGPDGELPDALRWQLRAMRRDQPPSRDLWAGIAARLGEQSPPVEQPEAAPVVHELPASVTVLRPRDNTRNRWMAPFALAAGVAALAIGIGSQFRAPQGPAGTAPSEVAAAAPATLMQREADGMTRQYQAAMREIEPATQQALALKPAFDELDRNAALILDALSHDPDSRLLLEQLRRTYARRLALAQRVAYT
ncbi:hypothetical protein [Pseudomonas sp. CGJS7]|uniref:hypothetical protein n=1 Tax=Pseudomonas sp. CGJS7 TaxID=3109348 RepID=UPI00300BE164